MGIIKKASRSEILKIVHAHIEMALSGILSTEQKREKIKPILMNMAINVFNERRKNLRIRLKIKPNYDMDTETTRKWKRKKVDKGNL